MIKAKVNFNSSGEGGNIFFILGQCKKVLFKENRKEDYEAMESEVYASTSYATAIKAVRKYVDLVDCDGKI